MSVAASIHELDPKARTEAHTHEVQLKEEHEALELLTAVPESVQQLPLIAIDLDDVLSQTNQSVADWHNENYGTKMTLSDFYYYYYWMNPYWGPPPETHLKVREYYRTDLIYNAKPVPGAREGVESLRQMGFRLVIVTARSEDVRDESWGWVEKYFPGCFERILCTGQFTDAHKKGHEVITRLSKAEVCNDLKAVLMIDDSYENALQCSTAEKPINTILFGDYQWNKRLTGPALDSKLDTTFDVRLRREGGRDFWKDDEIPFPEGAPLWRTRDWSDTVKRIITLREEGVL